MVSLVDYWVCIQAGINHDPVDEIINHGGDAIDTAEPVVQGGLVILHSHLCSSCFSSWSGVARFCFLIFFMQTAVGPLLAAACAPRATKRLPRQK
jgi:hypothetical protein